MTYGESKEILKQTQQELDEIEAGRKSKIKTRLPLILSATVIYEHHQMRFQNITMPENNTDFTLLHTQLLNFKINLC